MPTRRIYSMLLAAGLFLPGAPLSAQVPLSLDQCIRLALAAPSQVTQARLEVNISDYERTVARSGFLPRASLGVDYLYNSPSLTEPAAVSFLPADAIREFAALVTVVEEIDISGRVRAEYDRARANQDLAGVNLAIAERDLRRSVSDAYYRVLLARRLVVVFEEQLGEALDFEERTLILAEAGEVARADSVKATLQTASVRQALSAARTTAALANQALASFWTEDVTVFLPLVDVMDDPVPEPQVRLEDQPYLSRPEYLAFDARERGFRADARRARSDLRPHLEVAFQWGVDQATPGLSFNDRGYAVSASMRFNLFDGARAKSQIREADARAAQVDGIREVASREFSAEYESAVARVRGLYEQISLARVQVTAAEEDLRLSRIRYEGGEGPALEVVTAGTGLANARSTYYAAVSQYLTARVDLEVASGR